MINTPSTYSLPRYVFAGLLIFSGLTFKWISAHGQNLESAKDHFFKGEYQEALSALQKERRTVESLLWMSRCEAEMGNYDRAKKVILETANWQRFAQLHNQLGEIDFLLGKYEEAKRSFEAALAWNDNLLEARLNLASMQVLWGEAQKAREALQSFIDIYQKTPYADARLSFLVARACILLGRFQDASNLFGDAAKLAPKDWRIHVAWGRLFLQKFNYAEAQRAFEDALKLNPGSVQALVGLARSNQITSTEKSVKILEDLLEKHPDHLLAIAYATEFYTLLGDQEKATEYARALRKKAPHRLETLTALGNLALLRKDNEEFTRIAKELETLNPHYSEFYTAAGDLLTRRYLFAEAIDMYEKALQLNPEDANALAGHGTALSRLARLNGARQSLEKAFQLDPFNVCTGNLLSLFDSYEEYDTLRTAHFLIRMHRDDTPIIGAYAKQLAEAAYAEMVPRYGLELPLPVHIEIFPKHDDFAVRCFGLPGSQAFLGICFGPLVTMNSPRARPVGTFNWEETLWHEFAHVIHLTMTNNRIPRWLAEGIAVYEASRARRAWSMATRLNISLYQALKAGKLIPLSELDSGFTGDPRRVTFSYYQSSEMVAYIVDTHGFETLVKLLDAFRNERDTRRAISDVLRMSQKEFDRAFAAYVKKKYDFDGIDFELKDADVAHGKVEDGEELAKFVAENPRNYFATLRYGEFLVAQKSYSKAIETLERLKKLLPDYAGEVNPYSLLARAYLGVGDSTSALQNLQALTELDGKNYPAALQLGEMALALQQENAAVAGFEAAIAVYPYDAGVHRKLGDLYLRGHKARAAAREYRIELALNPTDRAGVHCRLAEALLLDNRKQEAKKHALLALEIAPSYRRAQEILLRTAR